MIEQILEQILTLEKVAFDLRRTAGQECPIKIGNVVKVWNSVYVRPESYLAYVQDILLDTIRDGKPVFTLVAFPVDEDGTRQKVNGQFNIVEVEFWDGKEKDVSLVAENVQKLVQK